MLFSNCACLVSGGQYTIVIYSVLGSYKNSFIWYYNALLEHSCHSQIKYNSLLLYKEGVVSFFKPITQGAIMAQAVQRSKFIKHISPAKNLMNVKHRLFLAAATFFSLGLLATEKESTYTIAIQEGCTDVYNALQSRGFFEIGNRKFLKDNYEELYRSFDKFIELMSSDKDFSINMHDLEKEFLSIQEYKKRYCSAPPSYRDPKLHSTKRFNKIYFQFVKDHYDFISIKHPEALCQKKSATEFLRSMDKLDTMAKELFVELIDKLEENRPGIKEILYGGHKELTVISKIVRYEKTEGWGTTPHCDKSAITLIWGSDDDNDDSLLLCEDMQNPSVKKLHKPKRLFSQKDDITSTILISGSACTKVGIDLKPTVHGVAPIQKEYRHAVISFLLIPDIDMSDLISDFLESAS